jgi:molecular chaperone HscA
MAAGAAKIQITFQLDADGLMNVTAKEVTSGSSHQIEINPAYGLSDADMIQHLQDNFENGLQDMEQRLLIESRVEANQLLIQLKTALKEDKDLLEGSEMNKLQKAIESLEETMVVDDRNAIKESMNQVEKLSFSFVERRINRSIQRALAGHHIKDII